MLVVGPNSTCDVCLECYTNGVNIPHAIACGHVFCQKCIEHLVQHKCPLCRTRFSPQGVRKLHVDRDPNVKAIIDEEPSHSTPSAPEADGEAQRLLNEIARIVKEGAKINEIRRVIDDCRTYYKSQGDQYTPVRVSCLLLHNVAEAQRKLSLQVDELKSLRAECDDVRERFAEELEAAELRCDDLQKAMQEERDAQLAKEKSLRDHYDEMNQSWLCEVLALERERDSLRQTLDCLKLAQSESPEAPVEMQCFYSADSKRASSSTDELTMLKKANMKQKLLDEDDMDFHLSPLVEVAVALSSTLPTFCALIDESDEEDLKKKKKKKVPSPEPALEVAKPVDEFYAETPLAYPRQPFATEPIPIPISARAAPSCQASSSSVTMSVTADYWPHVLSGSKPREDIVMSSRPSSPRRRGSTSDRHVPSQEAALKGKELYATDITGRARRDSEPATEDTWQILSSSVSKLHDLLDSPQTTMAVPHHVLSRQDIPRSSTACLSRSSTLDRSISRASISSRPSSTSMQPASGSEDPYFAQSERRPLVSASEAAMQLERERQEKERRRRHEASSTSSATVPVPNSLKDTTNAPVGARHHQWYRNDKMKPVHTVPGTACV